MAARKSLEGPWDLVGPGAHPKALDLATWIYKDIYTYTKRKCRALHGIRCELAAHFLQHICETLRIDDAKLLVLPDWKPVGFLFECGAWKKLRGVKLTSKTSK